jgi:hypothetical protein
VNEDRSAASFQSCQTLDGRRERVGLGKRNGRTTVLLTPEWIEGGPDAALPFPWLDDPRYYVNLNETQRRLWRLVLSGLSIRAIAQAEGVSRAAIYARIVGNSKGQGGMIAKNFWVLLWWHFRQRHLRTKDHV